MQAKVIGGLLHIPVGRERGRMVYAPLAHNASLTPRGLRVTPTGPRPAPRAFRAKSPQVQACKLPRA